MKSIGIGLIGSGFMGKCHALAFSAVKTVFPHVPRPRLEVLADSTLEKAQTSADQFGFARGTDDWRTLVEDPGVDVVSVTTPNALHHEMSLAAIEAGKHVYCEKPLGITLRQAEEMAAAAERAGVRTLVGYNYLKNPAAPPREGVDRERQHRPDHPLSRDIRRGLHGRSEPARHVALAAGRGGSGRARGHGMPPGGRRAGLGRPHRERACRDPHRPFARVPGRGIVRCVRQRGADRERGHRDRPSAIHQRPAMVPSPCPAPPGDERTGSRGRFTAMRACSASTRSV